MKISIYPLKRSDILEVTDIYTRIIHPAYISYGEINDGSAMSPNKFSHKAVKNFEKYITGFLGKRDRAVYVAFADKKPVGFVCVDTKKAKAGHKECWIRDLGVDTSFRRLGVAKKLMRQTYIFGKKQKVRYFFLESGYSNHNAHVFFEKEKFIPLNIVFIRER